MPWEWFGTNHTPPTNHDDSSSASLLPNEDLPDLQVTDRENSDSALFSSSIASDYGDISRNLVQEELPSPYPGKEETEKLVAATYNERSNAEREQALFDVHGVAPMVAEDAQHIQDQLRELQVQLDLLPNKKAYDMAKAASPEYVGNPKFGLMFLRSASYHPQEAAMTMIRHFETKLDLFGQDTLVRDLTLHDLPPQDLQSFQTGSLQLLPLRDRAGRTILCFFRNLMPAIVTLESRKRISFYLVMAALQDEETQRRGIVFVYCALGRQQQQYRRSAVTQLFLPLLRALPARFVGIHLCYDDEALRPFLNLGAFVVEWMVRIRLRHHFGTPLEAIYALMTFGIPRGILPLDDDGRVSCVNHEHWMQIRQRQEDEDRAVLLATTTAAEHQSYSNTTRGGDLEKIESQPLSQPRIVVPGAYDVIMGRGKVAGGNPGNLRLNHLIDTNSTRYEQASTKFEKTVVTESILGAIKDLGGRFLKQVDAGWNVVPDIVAREKISHAFRNRKRNRGGTASASTCGRTAGK